MDLKWDRTDANKINILKNLLDIFDIKKPEGSLRGSDIPRNILYVLNLPSYRLIKAFFTP
jgi:hypothetical protein